MEEDLFNKRLNRLFVCNHFDTPCETQRKLRAWAILGLEESEIYGQLNQCMKKLLEVVAEHLCQRLEPLVYLVSV